MMTKSVEMSKCINANVLIKIAMMNRALKEEKYAARRAILPILQAEEDER